MVKKTIKVMFTDMWRSFDLEKVNDHFEWRMISKHWNPILSNDPDFLFCSCFGNDHLKYDCTRIFYTPENIRPNFNRCDYAFSFDYPITERNYRLPLYRRWQGYKYLFNKQDPIKILSENRKFCNILISNPHAKERVEFFNKLTQYKIIDSGGGYLNNIGYHIERGVQNKLSWMRNYKFSIAFENSRHPGYTTEKLMHALISSTIPIYWGNPLASLDFNPKAFINCHDYSSFYEVIELIKEIDNNDTLYLEYLKQPYLSDNVETEFCKEENITARFDEILSYNKIFIPPYKKKLQRYVYFFLQLLQLANNIKRKIFTYGKHGFKKFIDFLKTFEETNSSS